MRGIFLSFPSSRTYVDNVEDGESIGECLQRTTSTVWEDSADWYLVCNGKLMKPSDKAEHGQTYHAVPRLVGGKGGFGSMLRAIGAQIEKTTNREACRDLSGRRMRDVNNEKKLREWVSKAAEREREKEQRRKDRWARLRAVPKHKFEDPEYHAQKQKVLEDLEESLHVGMQKATRPDEPLTSAGTSLGKRKAPPSAAAGSAKKALNDWIGVDLENASDLSSDESDEENSKDSSGSTSGRLGGSTSGSDRADDQHNEEKVSSSVGVAIETNNEMETDNRDAGQSSMELLIETVSVQQELSSDRSDKSDSSPAEDVQKSSSSNSSTDDMENVQNQDIHTSEKGQHSSSSTLEEKKSSLLSALAKVPPKEDKSEVKEQKDIKENLPHEELDLTSYDSIQDLEALGLDVLKADLQARGLKCGGTLTQRAERLWSVRGLTPDQYPGGLKAKPAKK